MSGAVELQVLLLDLIEDEQAIAAYEAWHAPGALPPAIAASIRRAGILSMDIYRSGPRLVMIIGTLPGFDPATKAASDAADRAVQAWEAKVGNVQRPLPWAPPSVKWLPAARIFSLAEQPLASD